jgi:hypothetical protein
MKPGKKLSRYTLYNTLESTDNKLFNVYPNPASHFLNIDYKDEKFKTINILNSQGELLENRQWPGYYIDMSWNLDDTNGQRVPG